MNFVTEKYVNVIKKQEVYEEKKKILEINGELLKNLSSEIINRFSDSSWQKELSDEFIKAQVAKSQEVIKDMPLSDRQLSEMDTKTMEQWLLLRGEGYQDRQIKALIKLIKSGKELEEVKRLFPVTTAAQSIEFLAEKLIQKE